MMECEECGKKLRVLEVYNHPMLGNKNYFCRSCFDKVSENVEKWMEFIPPYFEFFNNRSSDYDIKLYWKDLPANFIQLRKFLDQFWTGKEI